MVASCNLVALLVVAVLFLIYEAFCSMINGYKTIQEIAAEWNITPRQVQNLCASGKIPGADKLGRTWAIPADAIKPPDGREKTGEYRNWRKGKG